MQNTRLNNLVDGVFDRLRYWWVNWPRLLLTLIALLLGIYLGIAIAAISGQAGYQDVAVAGIVVVLAEVVSWAVYTRRWTFGQSLLGEALNALKIGIIYGLFVLAFILSS